jgi:hypothetical protein
MSKYEIERTFETKKEFHVREKKTWYRDTIYRGISHKSLLKEGYLNKDLIEAEKNGWLRKHQIVDKNGEILNAYIWLDREMPQRETFKRLLDKIYRFLKGEYKEYY